MRFVRDLHAVSEFFFFLLGFFILAAILFWRNDLFSYQAEMFLRYIDLPFAFVSLLFGGSSIRLSFYAQKRQEVPESSAEEWENPMADTILLILGALIFFGLLYIDLAFPDII